VPYLIDGNNLLGFITPSKFKDQRAKHDLVLRLQTFQKLKRTKIILVFDGHPDPNLPLKTYREKKFLVLFPPPDQNADQVIKEIILKQTDLRRFFVVSSDREIKNFAQAKGAKALSCKDFSRQLSKSLKENKKAREEEKNVSPPSPLEVDQWLEIFKGKND
jgi:predicted RNA-binding protein with PIN domain